MAQQKLSNLLRGAVIGLGVLGLGFYFGAIPLLGNDAVFQYPEFAYCYYPWLIFIWITAIPLYLVLWWTWSIACKIGKDMSFTMKNARSLKKISISLVTDSVIFFAGNAVLLFLNMNHPCILLASIFLCLFVVAIAIVANVLSHLVAKAAAIREENESFV